MVSIVLPRLPSLATVKQFLRFGVVGGMGFLVDTATVYLLLGAVGVYWAGALSYPVAASFTWAANRAWTFRGVHAGPAHRQWARFMAANLLGALLNRGTYFVMVALIPFAARHPVVALLGGVAAGMFVNFGMARAVVFR